MLGYCPSPYVTLSVLHVAPALHELAKQTIIPFVRCSQGFRLNDVWSNDLPPFTKCLLNGSAASFMTDGFELPVTEG